VEIAFTVANNGETSLGFTDTFNRYPVRVKDPASHQQYVNRNPDCELPEVLEPGGAVTARGAFDVPQETERLMLKLQFYDDDQQASVAILTLPQHH
jgi:hypothetical protein